MQATCELERPDVLVAEDEEVDFSTVGVTFADDEDLDGQPVMVCDGGAVSIGCAAAFCGSGSCYTTCTCCSIP